MQKKEIEHTAIDVSVAIARKPAWVKNEIKAIEAETIASEIQTKECKSAIEVGVASGFSSVVIFAALSKSTATPLLYSFDLSRECYFDKEHMTGDALTEMIGSQRGYVLRTGLTSGDIDSSMVPEPVDFVFIDASHKTPWAALDLISTSRFLAPRATIAFHDVDMIFKKATWRNNNGSRDIYRCWIGEKYRYEGATNLGFVVYEGDREALLLSIAASLLCDWDEAISENVVVKYSRMLEAEAPSSSAARLVLNAMLAKLNSARHFRPKLHVLPKETMRRMLMQKQYDEINQNVMAISRDGTKLQSLPTYALYYGAKARVADGKFDGTLDMLDIVLSRAPHHAPAAELKQELSQRRLLQ